MRVIWLAPLAFVLRLCSRVVIRRRRARTARRPAADELRLPAAAPPRHARGASGERAASERQAAAPRLRADQGPLRARLRSAVRQREAAPRHHRECLQKNDQQRVSIVGNTDERGTTEYNQQLGQRRAQAVANISKKGSRPDTGRGGHQSWRGEPDLQRERSQVLAAQPSHRGARELSHVIARRRSRRAPARSIGAGCASTSPSSRCRG